METKAVMIVLDMALKYGVPVVMDLVRDWGKDTVTVEDLLALKERVKDPESYFAKPEAKIADRRN